MNYRTFYLLFLLFASSSCDRSIEAKLAKRGEDCGAKGCEINLTDITDFEWDKVYIYNHPTTLENVSDTLGIRYENFVEHRRPIIFLYKNKIVHAENHMLWSDEIDDGQVVFDEYNYYLHVYTSNNAKFILRKERYSSDVSFYLLVNTSRITK